MDYRKTFNRITFIVWNTVVAIFVMWSITLQTTEADSLFDPAVPYDTDASPRSVAIGDLNGDGNPDLAVATQQNDKVSVLLGKEDGSFQDAENYDAGDAPYFVAIGDLNGDGNPDLAVATQLNDKVSVLLGNGDGSFQDAKDYDAGDAPVSVAIGDLNGDDYLDLAVTNWYSDNVSVLLGNGDGSFQDAENYDAGDAPFSVAIGDLNGDGYLDLAVANNISNNVSVLLGNGDGSFQDAENYDAGDAPYSVAIGDLNGDGNPDLAVANWSSDDVSVFINIGEYQNQPPIAICQDVTIQTESGFCMADASVDDGSFDPDGDNITLEQTPLGPYDLGNTEVTLTVTDNNGASGTCNATVTVVDEEAPVIYSVTGDPNKLWPPNHKMVPVVLAVDVFDNCDSVCQIISVESNEPVRELGIDNTDPDWVIRGDLAVELRAERSGTGSGRVYTITVGCTDQSWNSSIDTIKVTVPHDKGKKKNLQNKKKK